MNSFPDINRSGWGTKAIRLPEQGSARGPAGAFQQYLDRDRTGEPALATEKMTPDAIKALAANLMLALDRASMNALFSDTDSGSGNASSGFLSTDLFMALRNSTTSAIAPVQESQTAAPVAELNSVKTTVTTGHGKDQYAPIIAAAAESYGLDPKLIEAVIKTESDFNAAAVSPVGAQGLMQLMPGTAADLGVTDAFDPEQNIQAGSKYLKQLMDRYDGDAKLALAAYNWGMGNLERHPERMPEETVNYVAKITGLMNRSA